MGQLKLGAQAVADTPPSGYINIYNDTATGLPFYKDSAGATHQFVTGLTNSDKLFLTKLENVTFVLVTANSYQNLACDGMTDDAANFNALMAAVPDHSVLLWPPCTMMLNSNVANPSGKHLRYWGAGIQKTIWQSNAFATDMFTCNDWYQDFQGITFQGNTTTTSAVANLSTTASNVAIVAETNLPSSGAGSCYMQTSTNTWVLVNFTASTPTQLTNCTIAFGTATINSGAVVQFKTGGYAINGQANAYIVVRDCQFSNCYNGIFHGQTVCQIRDSYFSSTVNFDMQFNGSGVNSIVHNITADGQPPAVAHMEVNLCGSILISDCDLIRATNNLRINPTSPNGCFGIYATNTYFDTAGGSCVKIQGTGNVQRIKFSNCWLSSSSTGSGLEIAGTGTTLPTAIDLDQCDIYNNANGSGVLVNGCQDVGIANCRIAGNGNGISLNPSTGGVTTLKATNNRIGPTGGIGANTYGINIFGGTYNGIQITGNDMNGNTNLNLSDGASVGTLYKIVKDNPGASVQGGLAATVANVVVGTAATQVQVVGVTLPAGSISEIGQTFRIRAFGQATVTTAGGTITFTVRIGTATLTGTAICSIANTTVLGTAIGFSLEALVTVRNNAVSGTVIGVLFQTNTAATGLSATANVMSGPNGTAVAAVTVNTNVSNVLELTALTSATTSAVTFFLAEIEAVK